MTTVTMDDREEEEEEDDERESINGKESRTRQE